MKYIVRIDETITRFVAIETYTKEQAISAVENGSGTIVTSEDQYYKSYKVVPDNPASYAK